PGGRAGGTDPDQRGRTGTDTDRFPFGPVTHLTYAESERKVTLRWDKTPNAEMFLGYYLEVSDDGQNFSRINEVPLVKEVPDEYFEHPIDLEENYRPRYYRLRGVNAFAEVGPPSEAVRAQGVDQVAPQAPGRVQATDRRDGTFGVSWELPATSAPDLAGYVVVRGTDLYGKMVPAHSGLLATTATDWTDPKPIPYQSNYYAVLAVDTAGNSKKSPAAFAMWYDDTPPAAPVGLTGRIDTLGNVFLMWEPGAEPDLHGYRVYVSHAKKREFFQVTEEILHQNYYFDSTRLNVLNEDVYYEVVALDNNFNPSARSEILTLRRPDKIAPAKPVIVDFAARGESVELRWRPSISPDAVRQEIWRKDADGSLRALRSLPPTDSVFVDTTTQKRVSYTYFVRALDEVSLYADSHPLSVRSGAVSARANVTDLARTQVPGTDREKLSWTAPRGTLSGYQLYGGPEGDLRPLRRLDGELTEWFLPEPDHHYALQVIYSDGSRSPLSAILKPAKK
ncbi:MAG: fibronectin type III domain-containing protein, partial [Bacteroidota bacterium]